jgi:hypothetical protein
MNLSIEQKRDEDGRRLAEVPELPGVLAYGPSVSWPRCCAKVGRSNANPVLILSCHGSSDFVFAFHDGEEIGPKMLARIAKHTGLTSNDL